MRDQRRPWAQVERDHPRNREAGRRGRLAGESSLDTGQPAGVAGFGGNMGARVRGLASEASRDEGPRHSAGAGTVPGVELACMLVEVASGPSVAMRTWLHLVGAYSEGRASVA